MVSGRHGLHWAHALKEVRHATAPGHVLESAQTLRLLLMGRSAEVIGLRMSIVISAALVSDLSSTNYKHSSVFQIVKTAILNKCDYAFKHPMPKIY